MQKEYKDKRVPFIVHNRAEDCIGNSPETVARTAVNVLPDYLYEFKNIEYAVYCPPRDDMNYRVFDRVLKAVK